MIRALVAVIAALIVVLGVQSCRLHGAQMALADQEIEAATDREAALAAMTNMILDVRRREREAQERHNTVVAELQEQLTNAQLVGESVTADLRAARLRLREHWACPAGDGVPGTPGAAASGDAGAALRERDSGHLVRIGAECDARIRAAQAVIRTDRQ
ncbi:hypothetical protein [Coralloluteibacterium thermophilus]|uniref:Lysozyme n=1 Tax=Coralloluteibacterium thermophilum TaxID=2707049 RepID=A0ABV9NP50_9GAMM